MERSYNKRLAWARLWKHSVEWETLSIFVGKREYASRGGLSGGVIEIKLTGQNPAESGKVSSFTMEDTSPLRDKREKKGKEKIKTGDRKEMAKPSWFSNPHLLPGSFKPHPVFL